MWSFLKFTAGVTVGSLAIERLRKFAAPAIGAFIFIGISALAAIKIVVELADYVSK